MWEKIKAWCGDNSAVGKVTRTIFQGIIGVLIANIDILVGSFSLDAQSKTMIVALVMAILSPIQAALGKTEEG